MKGELAETLALQPTLDSGASRVISSEHWTIQFHVDHNVMTYYGVNKSAYYLTDEELLELANILNSWKDGEK